MDTSEPQDLENLSDPELVERLRCADWHDPLFVSEERLVQLFEAARAAGYTARVGHCSNELSRRMLRRSRAFALKNTLVPQHFPNLDEAAEALADYVWERLLLPKNAQFAARRFGVFFENKSISFLRSLLAKCRVKMESLEDWHQDSHAGNGDDESEDEYDVGDAADATLQDELTPDQMLSQTLSFEQVNARLQVVLTGTEYSVYMMLWRRQWKIKDIAAALGVGPRMINNHKRSIKEKITKEFNV